MKYQCNFGIKVFFFEESGIFLIKEMNFECYPFLYFYFLIDLNISWKKSGIGLKNNGFSSCLPSIVVFPFLFLPFNNLTAYNEVMVNVF